MRKAKEGQHEKNIYHSQGFDISHIKWKETRNVYTHESGIDLK